MEMYRQGDVLLVKVEALPKHAEELKEDERIVLAYGEVTGHAHAIAATQARMFVEGDLRFIQVSDMGAELRHEEHRTINLAPGVYRIVHQREYVPGASRLVED